jgi:hypothetical protein
MSDPIRRWVESTVRREYPQVLLDTLEIDPPVCIDGAAQVNARVQVKSTLDTVEITITPVPL